ncbi:MAG: FecR domain-containing protein [Gammaproteobacteria bacterium]
MTTASDFEAQAAAWLVKRDGGGLSAADQAEFDAWLQADPRAHAAYVRLELGWKRADSLRRLRPLDGGVDEDLLAHSPFEPVPMDEYPARQGTGRTSDIVVSHAVVDAQIVEHKPEPGRRWAMPLAAAASIVLIAAAGLTWRAYERTGWHEYTTDFGGLSRIVLDDGSVVNLNTNSLMRAQITPELRHIVLERGEALFKVAHDKNRPFDVDAGSTTVRAVGTEFSVRVRDVAATSGGGKDVEVLVKEGRVAIDPPKKNAKPIERAAALPPSMSTLSAGEAVTITATRVTTELPQMQVQKVAEADVDRKLSWTEGRLWFERQTLKDVVAEFNRYNRRQMVIADPAIENLRIGGGFEATDPESFIAALEKTLGVRAFPSPSSDGDGAEVIRLVGTRETNN